MTLILRLVVTALAVLAAAYIVPGITLASFGTALIVGLVLGLINLIIKPILKLLTLPLTIITLGLFSFVLNGFLLWLASLLVDGFTVEGFWAAVLGALVVSLVSAIGESLLGLDD